MSGFDRAAASDADAEAAGLARRIAESPATAAEAEAALVRLFAPRVRLYGLKHLRDADLAADLVQQVLLVTIERLRAGAVREPERIASFILGASRMIARDLRRASSRSGRLADALAHVVDAVVLPREPVDRAPLERCLGALSPRDRAVVLLSYYAERPTAEIGRELSLSTGNVRVIRHRALAQLRDCLETGTGGAR